MTDLSEFEAMVGGPGPRCGMVRVFAELPDDKADTLRAALAADHITARAISKVVTGWGVKVSDQTVTRHRAGRCSCP